MTLLHPARCSASERHRCGGLFLTLVMVAGWSLLAEDRFQTVAFAGSLSARGSARAGQQTLATANDSPDLAEEALRTVSERLKQVRSPDRSVLANALGLSESSPDSSEKVALSTLTDLDGDGAPETILKWTRFSPQGLSGETADTDSHSWVLILLSWDGTQWRASKMLAGDEAYTLAILPQRLSAQSAFAVVLFESEQQVPYPLIFRVQDHAALLAWDSRSDDSRYQGHVRGKVEFRKAPDAPEMVVTGRADPGIITFPPESPRGFDATTVYRWQDGAYVPAKTHYASNPDYTLYQFISALHLHDFRTAYAQIDPGKFLKTDQPSLDLFRVEMEKSWPEFLDDQVFDVPVKAAAAPADYAFELNTDDQQVRYIPRFSDDDRHVIVSLEKQERK